MTDKPTASAAIFYKADEYDPYKRMMGRQVASNAFLKAAALHEPPGPMTVYSVKREETDVFAKVVGGLAAPRGPIDRSYRWVAFGDTAGLASAGTLYRPDPVLHEEAWARLCADPRAYSLTGVTHTLSSLGAQRAIQAYLTSPYESWDAVICTSQAVRAVVDKVVAEMGWHLADRFGMAVPPKPVLQLPVIPLGVHAADFDCATEPMQAARVRWRKKIGAAEGDVIALFVGRLAYHAKANPMPMYRALETAAKRTGKTVHLVQVGWFGTDYIEKAFRDGARTFAPSVKCHFMDGRDPKVRADIWAVGDFFTSLVDNIQETFGLAPLEAMAAGMPVVVSDWDGYRETVRDGIDGITVPTVQTPAGFGEGMAHRHLSGQDNYDSYIAQAALNVAVDTAKAADAYAALIADPALRARMGEAGKKRARDTFDWGHIYRAYRELWGELAQRRAKDQPRSRRRQGMSRNPAHPDPFRLFSHYTTRTLGPRTVVRLAPDAGFEEWRRRMSHALLNPGRPGVLMDGDELKRLHDSLLIAPEGLTIDAIAREATAGAKREAAVRSLVWLAKAGLLDVVDAVEIPDRAGPYGA